MQSAAATETSATAASDQVAVNEIFHSIQGESTWAGRLCVFVRLSYCNLRCRWCDTAYAFYEGSRMGLDEIVEKTLRFECPLVELTGGEPLLQKNALPLLKKLCDAELTVLLETSGSADISEVDPRVHRIMDIKTPGSGESSRNLWSNIERLGTRDEVKFVIDGRADYEWSRHVVREHELERRCKAVLFSPVFGELEPRNLAQWILEDRLPVRFQLQLHKFIWEPDRRGV